MSKLISLVPLRQAHRQAVRQAHSNTHWPLSVTL